MGLFYNIHVNLTYLIKTIIMFVYDECSSHLNQVALPIEPSLPVYNTEWIKYQTNKNELWFAYEITESYAEFLKEVLEDINDLDEIKKHFVHKLLEGNAPEQIFWEMEGHE